MLSERILRNLEGTAAAHGMQVEAREQALLDSRQQRFDSVVDEQPALRIVISTALAPSTRTMLDCGGDPEGGRHPPRRIRRWTTASRHEPPP
jgi:hypothetical protein